MSLSCPMCKKELTPGVNPCPRCRADLTLLVDYMSNLEEHLNRADAAMKSGELGEAVWAYLNVLETDPDHAVARRQIGRVATAVRQFDDAKRSGAGGSLLTLATLVAAAVLALAVAFYVGYELGSARPDLFSNSSSP